MWLARYWSHQQRLHRTHHIHDRQEWLTKDWTLILRSKDEYSSQNFEKTFHKYSTHF